jgi:superfamily I DNA/RNA helicase
LLADGFAAGSMVAFSFTERAAGELASRIAHGVEDRLDTAALDRLAGLFVGTIHSFCFQFLQQRVPRYETYDVLADNQLAASLSREPNRLGIRQLDAMGRRLCMRGCGRPMTNTRMSTRPRERLIQLLTGPNTELSVAGDDQQAMRQWRGRPGWGPAASRGSAAGRISRTQGTWLGHRRKCARWRLR